MTWCLSLALTLAAPVPVVLGDYDAELRQGDHVDGPLMLQRLKDLGADTYMWLMWHSANDWDDLKAFLPAAAEAGITLWAYLVPHSETPFQDPRWPYSEPFRLDYVRWAEEIGKLSLRYPNLVGYVIDDFWGNFGKNRFTPEYVANMVAAGKAANPKLKFYPLMYYQQFDARFADELAPLIDGAVAAYPRGPGEIRHALDVLNDRFRIPDRADVIFPKTTPSRPGDHGYLVQTAKVLDADTASLTFTFEDTYDGPTKGYHVLEVRVDDKLVWESDAGGADQGTATVPLADAVRGKTEVTLRLGVTDRKGVAEFALAASFAGLKATGLELAAPELTDERWREETRGAFTIKRFPARSGQDRFHLPLIVMTAGSPGEFKHRHGTPGTPSAVAKQVAMALEFARRGEIAGVVTYCLDKRPGNPHLDAVAAEFRKFRETTPTGDAR